MTLRQPLPQFCLLFISLFCLRGLFGATQSVASQLRVWEVFELTLEAQADYDNPYNEILVNGGEDLLEVVFTGTSGPAKGRELSVTGFWDGGDTWKARFAAPAVGTWQYTSASTDAGLDGATGELEVIDWTSEEKAANAIRHGFLQVRQQGEHPGRFFEYSDGTPFLWVADTWWNWTNRKIKTSTYRKMVDDRASKGFNLGQLFVAANGWGAASSLLDETFTELDVEHMQKVDDMITYANSKGITVWVHGWWSRENLDTKAGAEKMKRWWRYLVHRLGAYNVIWVPGGEYNLENYGGLGLSFWKDLGSMIDAEDPYERIIGMHPTPPYWSGGEDAPQWSTAEVLHHEPWLDYNQSQVGHGRVANEMIPDVVRASYAKQPAKPIVVTEPWYEFIEGNPTGRDIRFGAWTAILSGAAGHSYGGGHVWLAHVPEAPAGGGPWPLQEHFRTDTLDYEGAVSISHLARFFENVKWWQMAPHPEFVLEYPDPYCLANPGEEYVAYLRWGGTVKIDLTDAVDSDTFECRFLDPSTGEFHDSQSVQGGEIHFFSSPESYPGTTTFRDWVLYLSKSSQS